MGSWIENTTQLNMILEELSVWDRSQKELGAEMGFKRWKNWTLKIRSKTRTIFFVGNGASASMASHFAADMAKNGGIHTRVFTDAALLTAVGNDISYEEIFAEPLRWYCKKGDMLVAVSSSGRSPNVVTAIEAVRSLGGTVVTLSAMGADNPMRNMGNMNIFVPAKTYGLAETAHATVLHYWMDLIQQTISESKPRLYRLDSLPSPLSSFKKSKVMSG